MFRHGRGRPLLGAAVIVGASRSAARHEVAAQGQHSADMQQAIDRAADQKNREQDARNMQTQQAINTAILKERARVAQESEAQPPTYDADKSKAANGAHSYCGGCGIARKREDKFCGKCGFQYRDSAETAFDKLCTTDYAEKEQQVQ